MENNGAILAAATKVGGRASVITVGCWLRWHKRGLNGLQISSGCILP
jgi:hypothetical protein